jgi:DNA replication protein DnaC
MTHPIDDICQSLQRLKLDAFERQFTTFCDTFPQHAPMVSELLFNMATEQLAKRHEARIKRCITQAQFVRIQTVDQFDFEYNPSTRKLRHRYLRLIREDAVGQGVGAVFVGNAGLGKTHLARALGYAACQLRNSVLFVSSADLLNRLTAAEATGILNREIKKLLVPKLLIIDELAYLSMSQQEANLFFQIVSRRHDALKSIVVTSNKPFAEWNQVFSGDAIAHAIVDRLTERAEIFFVEGKSYRQTHRKGLDPK